MPDLGQLNRNKERILSTIRLRGPSLPVQIASAIGVSPLFASAFLSELKAEDKIKISNMRVGSSPLYFLPGQEDQLDKFSQYLNPREREALNLLKEKQFLVDEEQEPVVRVALRAIKDFAVPVKIRVNGESKLFWKFFSLNDEEVMRLIKRGGKVTHPPARKVAPPAQKLIQKTMDKIDDNVDSGEVKPKERKVKVQETEFSKSVKDYLLGKDIEILDVLSEKKREFEAKVRIDTMFGKQVYYLFAKDKKNVTDNDLGVAWQKGQNSRVLALFMSTGELSKKAREHLKDWGNLVRWERLKF